MSSGLNDRKPLWPIGSLVVLTGLNLLDYLDRQILGSVLELVKADLKFSDEQMGWLPTAFMWGYFLTSPLFGYLGDRLPRRWLVAAGVFVWSVGTLMTGHVSHFWALIIFRVLVGFGEASFGTISPGWIADLFPTGKRNNAITIFYLAIPVGSALGYILGSQIGVRYGWRDAFLWAGYPGLLLAGLLFLLREPRRGASDNEADFAAGKAHGTIGWRSFLTLFKFPRYLLVVAGYAAQTFAMGGFAHWAPTFLHRSHEMSIKEAGWFFGLALASTGLVATLAGGLAATAWQRRTGRGYVWVLALSATMAGPLAYLAFSASDLLIAKAALIGAMFFLFLTTGPVNTLILETVPITMRATAMAGSIFAIHMFGDLWTPPLIGYIADKGAPLQQACLWVLPPALVVSSLLWFWLVAWTAKEKRDAQAL